MIPQGRERIARAGLGVLAVALALVTAVCVADSLVWLDRPFMGFVLGRNRIVAPIGLEHWSGFRAGVPFGAQLTHADGVPVNDVPRLVEQVWAVREGTPIRYRFATNGGTLERTVPVMWFGLADYLSLFGMFLVNGVLYLVVGLLVAWLKPGRPASAALLAFSVAWGLTLVVSLADFYRFRFRDLYAVAQAAAPAGLVLLGLTFPDRGLSRRGAWILGALLAATLVHAALDIGLYERAPLAWMRFFDVSVVYGMLSAVVAIGLLRRWYRRAPPGDRVRMQVVGLGALIALGLPAVVQLASMLMREPLPVNVIPLATGIFPLALAYAVLKQDVLRLDPLVTRGVYYAVLTAVATAGWIGLLGVIHARSPGALTGPSAWLPFLFTIAMVSLVTPLRRVVQQGVDRLFYRLRYDPEATIEAVSRSLAASLDREHLTRTIRDTLEASLAPAPCMLVLPDAAGRFVLPDGQHLPAVDPVLEGGGIEPIDGASTPGAAVLAAHGVVLVVPLRSEGRLEGLLALGPKRSGAPYGARDLGVLRTIANQAAIAFRNAASYAELRALTATLEERVVTRTAELTHAQQQLAQADKLASLGRLVAGVAHEINNPVAFINASVDLIHEAAARVRQELNGQHDPRLSATLDRLLENAVICRDGAVRAARIVRELQTFARVQPDHREAVDLHAALERSLRLLRGEYKNRIAVIREFGSVPQPQANPGEIDQVLMNLLSNAMQAIDGPGEVRLRTWAGDGSVWVEVRDSGRGIPPEALDRIFEPFFTTRTGEGTGLGLAIVHSLVTRHGGDIEATSAPGEGTTFTVRLPVAARPAPVHPR